jgi:hypothetical protein
MKQPRIHRARPSPLAQQEQQRSILERVKEIHTRVQQIRAAAYLLTLEGRQFRF